ncbi:glycosyltransferase family 4 protein [Mastigocoleus testarum]|uniref:Group 1 glycosyl transferase n=1 Tax=Mastigocoleus testarum BC008 TaxID=371196 RepID=A0A0V7ZLW3_9CYAN|nr:glycosyltransferase family 4 protein [Mastigocoleus testarum]KST65319.1 group 1 glycosyl transferase [Mastigocoleus testarum BC008]KST65627.1 group 1 glycosyl transferase [Mastigocoleus testarum BC008]
MENERQDNLPRAASILCLGTGWFPTAPGGLERYVYELTRCWATKQDNVELCGVGIPEATEDFPIKLNNLASPDSPIWQRLWSIRQNFRQTRNAKPDAINLHFALYSFPLLDIFPKEVPITFNFHGPWASESKQEVMHRKISNFLKYWLIERKTYHSCDRFIVLSKAFGNVLHQEYQIPWEKINIIPGGVDINNFKANFSLQEARLQLNWPQDRQIIFTSRRLVHRVGIDKLLTAFATIRTKIPDVWLAIAGRGPLEAELKQQVKDLELEDRVKFLGFLPDEQLPIAYQAADFSIMPSQSFEGFGLAIVESLACGTPVICTPVGGMPEILTPFSPQLITSSISANSIAKKLEQALLAKVSIPSKEDCRQYASANFNWNKIANEVRGVLLSP